MKEIALLPENLLRMPSVGMVNQWYERSFEEITRFENTEPTPETLDKFCSQLLMIRNRHVDVVQTMAQGVLELKESHEVDASTEHSLQYFLDRFYMSRISIRMLINQHTLLFGTDPSMHGREVSRTGVGAGGRHVGCIDPACDVVGVVRDAYENARFLCDRYYLAAPELELLEHNDVESQNPIRIVYVPSHLYHMLFELFKNAMRAVMEKHESSPPAVQVTIVRGREDICVKMSDRGGGIPRSVSDLLFKYMYSTAPQPSKSDAHTVPLAGYGYGLPLSRLYARYFHGDLVLMSCEGYGTDAMIYMKALSNEANELLPIFNRTSSRFYRATTQLHDWSGATTHASAHTFTTRSRESSRAS